MRHLRLQAPNRPVELDDRDWLAAQYATHGDRAIAKELGCARSTVTRARERLGIASHAEGRRRGQPLRPVPTSQSNGERDNANPSLAALTFHFKEDHRHKTPPSREMLIARCQGWLDADRHHDHDASQHALLSMASGALLVHEHHAKLKEAA